MSTAERNIEAYRSIYLTMVALIFAGFIAIAVADPLLDQDLRYGMYFSVISFLSYLCASNFRSYEFTGWQAQFGKMVSEIGSLSLVLSVIAIVLAVYPYFAVVITTLGILIWTFDHIVQLSLTRQYLADLEDNGRK